MRKALAAVAVALLVALTGCGSTDEGTAGSQTGQAENGPTLEVTVHGDEITPNGERVEVGTNKEITLQVDADRPGSFHVHSSPEQSLDFDKGRTTLTFTVDKPGVVEVEEHESGLVVLQLEVR